MAFREIQSLDAEKVFRLGEEGTDENTIPSITGYYLGYRETPNSLNPGKMSRIHVFSVEGKNVGVWGATVLDKKLAAVAAPSNPHNSTNGVASMTEATFTGEIPPSKKGYRPSKNFSVRVDDTNTMNASVAVESSISTGADSDIDAGDFTDEAEAFTPAKTVTKAQASAVSNLLKRK